MDIVISNSGGAPIYEQISSQIKAQIISGELMEGDLLPSIRALAKELRISVITTKRAYEELEREAMCSPSRERGLSSRGWTRSCCVRRTTRRSRLCWRRRWSLRKAAASAGKSCVKC